MIDMHTGMWPTAEARITRFSLESSEMSHLLLW